MGGFAKCKRQNGVLERFRYIEVKINKVAIGQNWRDPLKLNADLKRGIKLWPFQNVENPPREFARAAPNGAPPRPR